MTRTVRYRVNGPLVGMQPGDVVTATDLVGCNIRALVEGGHLSVVTDTEPTRTVKKELHHGA